MFKKKDVKRKFSLEAKYLSIMGENIRIPFK